ncbi:MAG TPA: carbohydrate ABC transporter permease [Anaerolineaceae bacterium]
MAVTQEAVIPAVQAAKRTGSIKADRLIGKILTLALLTLGSLMVMLPLFWMLTTALKTEDTSTTFPPQWIPRDVQKVEIKGRSYFLYWLTVDGKTQQMAMLKKRPGNMAIFVDPKNPDKQYQASLIGAQRVSYINLHWENFPKAMTMVPFFKYFQNTMVIVLTTTIGVLISCVLVAYGFSRFRAPWFNLLFLVLLSTIMLPPQVTLIPTFVFFQKLGWYNTFLPLIVPAFFANAWDVFLLRQFFMTVPIEMDEAAKIDGASPLGVLWHILLPQAWPAVATVAIFHFLYAWNDFLGPLIYIQSQSNWTMAIGLQSFNAQYSKQLTTMMAAATVTMLPCLILFFAAQKLFIQGVVVSGIKG